MTALGPFDRFSGDVTRMRHLGRLWTERSGVIRELRQPAIVNRWTGARLSIPMILLS